MAGNADFGSKLREARTKAGMTLDEAGRRLRIEPKILDAIESADFEHMPPKYVTRSMVNAYAQMMGLNATAMTREFLDAELQYRLSSSGNGLYDNSQANNQISTRIAKPSAIAAAAAAYDSSKVQATRPVQDASGLPRTTGDVSYRTSAASAQPAASSVWTKGASASVAGSASRAGTRSATALSSDSGRQRVSVNDTTETAPGKKAPRRNPDGTIRRPHFTALEDPDVDYGDAPASSVALGAQAPKRDFSRLFMIVGCVLAVVLIVVLIKVIFVPETPDDNPGTDQPISGLTDPEQTGMSTGTSTTTRVPIKPTACYVSIQIGDRDVNLDLATTSGSFFDSNGDLYLPADVFFFSGTVSSGSRYQYDVTEKMYIRTSFPNDVTVTVNGERVEFTKIGWRYVIIVDFPAYLEQWEKDHADQL